MAKKRSAKRKAATRGPRPIVLSTLQRRIVVLAAIVLVNLVLDGMWYRYTRPAAAGDYKDYIELAAGLVQYHQFGYPEATARRLPAYPALLAGILMLWRSYIWVVIWNMALTASIGVLTYFFTLRLTRGNERTAAVAGLLCAASPTFFFFSSIFASEHLFAPALIGSFLLLLAERPRPILRVLLAGILFGVATLTRGEGIFYLPVAVLLVFATSSGARRRAILTACLVVAILLVITPWYIRNRVVMGPGAGLSTYGGVNFYYAHNPREKYGWFPIEESPLAPLSEMERNREGYRLGLEYLRERPSRLLREMVEGTRELYTIRDVEIVRTALWVPAPNSATGVPFRRRYPTGTLGLLAAYFAASLLLAAGGAVYWRRYPIMAWLVPVGILIMNWFCHTVVFWGKPRFRYTSEAFLYILVAITITELSRRRWRLPRVRTS